MTDLLLQSAPPAPAEAQIVLAGVFAILSAVNDHSSILRPRKDPAFD